MKKALRKIARTLFWPSTVITDDISQVQRDIDAERGVRPINHEPRDFYRRLSEVPSRGL